KKKKKKKKKKNKQIIKNSYWNEYLLTCQDMHVRCHVVGLTISAMQAVLTVERPLYYVHKDLKIEDPDVTAKEVRTSASASANAMQMQMQMQIANTNANANTSHGVADVNKQDLIQLSYPAAFSEQKMDNGGHRVQTTSDDVLINLNMDHDSDLDEMLDATASLPSFDRSNVEMQDSEAFKKIPNQNLVYFQTRSIVVTILDQTCKLLLQATHYWKQFDQYWLFFKNFAELGCPERQLLLERHWVTECIRFQQGKKKPDLLSQLITDDKMYSPIEMTSDTGEPNYADMLEMIAILVCSSAPPKLKKELEMLLRQRMSAPDNSTQKMPVTTDLFQQHYSYIYNRFGYQWFIPNLPETTMVHSNALLTLPTSESKTLSNPTIWNRLLRKNPHAVSRIICHLSWMNKEYSKKCVSMFIKYFETVE
ncbi:hypothetical protein RFI_23096, partial [Reticulomyxa filosa]